jgi:hypothetical protein
LFVNVTCVPGATVTFLGDTPVDVMTMAAPLVPGPDGVAGKLAPFGVADPLQPAQRTPHIATSPKPGVRLMQGLISWLDQTPSRK